MGDFELLMGERIEITKTKYYSWECTALHLPVVLILSKRNVFEGNVTLKVFFSIDVNSEKFGFVLLYKPCNCMTGVVFIYL